MIHHIDILLCIKLNVKDSSFTFSMKQEENSYILRKLWFDP